MFLSNQEHIRKRAKKYYPETLKSWLLFDMKPHAEKKVIFSQNVEKINEEISYHQSIISEVRKRTEEEISILTSQNNAQSQLDAKKMAVALADQLKEKFKVINELNESKIIESEAFKLALTHTLVVSRILLWFYSLALVLFLISFAWIDVHYKNN